MQWNTWPPGELRSFANSTRTHEGGAHEQGFRTALTDLVNHYARRQRQISANDEDITAEAIHEGLTAVVSVKLAHPVFEGSTRTSSAIPKQTPTSKKSSTNTSPTGWTTTRTKPRPSSACHCPPPRRSRSSRSSTPTRSTPGESVTATTWRSTAR
ncbi:hypothetical protein [Streptomyces sp. AK08-01B]